MLYLTIEDLKELILGMEKANTDKVGFNVENDGYCIEKVSFELWENGEYIKTLLESKKENANDVSVFNDYENGFVTINDLKLLLKEMSETDIKRVTINVKHNGYYVESISFEIWKNGKFIEDILTLEE